MACETEREHGHLLRQGRRIEEQCLREGGQLKFNFAHVNEIAVISPRRNTK